MYSEPFPVEDGRSPPAVLTIAASDSGGGAGIQADLKTFTALGCYGASVVTAVTAQNTRGVQGVHSIPPEFVESQLRSVLDDIPIAAIKIGMLSNAGVMRAVARTLRAWLSAPKQKRRQLPIVIGPMCVWTWDHTLLERDALNALVDELLPLATVITPNHPEVGCLLYREYIDSLGFPGRSLLDSMLYAACKLRGALAGDGAVLLKGGQVAWPARCRVRDYVSTKGAAGSAVIIYGDELGDECEEAMLDPPEILINAAGERRGGSSLVPDSVVVDILCERDGEGEGKVTLFVRPYLEWNNTHGVGGTHGAGCTLSAALVCALARGKPLVEAVKLATMYTHQGIATAFPIGVSGTGPLNHIHSLLPRTLKRPTPSDPYPLVRTLIRSNAGVWGQYVRHEFVRQLGEGTLSRERFLHFIKQDYHYLKYYARANSLLMAKSLAYADFAAATEIVLSIVREREMNVVLNTQWGIDLAELENIPESPACTAYGAYIMDIGMQGDGASLLVALAACLLGYGEVGLWLMREAKQPRSSVHIENNPYSMWIKDYSGERYQAAVKAGIEKIEALVIHDPPSPKTLELWKSIWGRCTRLEKGFWDMAMDLS